jgi:DNA-binding NarL/FixJ family response regulator
MLGLRDADIGLRMNIAHNTVRKVLNAIYTKTGMGSKPELMAFVFEHQIILRGCRALD